MKVAHFAVVTPKRCGLYETTHDTVRGLRSLGIDSRMVDPTPESNPVNWSGDDDRGVPVSSIDWAVKSADVIVSHSGIGDIFKGVQDRPFVYVAHGRPYVSYLAEKHGGLALQSYHYSMNYDAKWKAIVSYWPEHEPFLNVLFPDKPVYTVQSSVDLDEWRVLDEAKYDFGGKAGEINVVISDAWREDIDPYLALNAYALWARTRPWARLHIYGLPNKQPGAWALVKCIENAGGLGEVKAWSTDLLEVYNAADFVLTPHKIDVRTVREATACGCPVVRVGESLQFEQPRVSRAVTRAEACTRFDSRRTALQFKAILESLDGRFSKAKHSGNG